MQGSEKEGKYLLLILLISYCLVWVPKQPQ